MLWYFLLIGPAAILGLIAQARVKSAFQRYSQVPSSQGLTGTEAARRVLDGAGLYNVSITVGGGRLSDHYDPRSRSLTLSPDVGNSTSLAALGVAAHEAGHAIQHAEGYAAMRLRSAMVPVATTGSNLGMALFFIGVFFGASWGMPWLAEVGIILFSAAVLFTIVTLPVEFNASNRAMKQLADRSILLGNELAGAKKVLNAAALTYVAAALMALLNLLWLIMARR